LASKIYNAMNFIFKFSEILDESSVQTRFLSRRFRSDTRAYRKHAARISRGLTKLFSPDHGVYRRYGQVAGQIVLLRSIKSPRFSASKAILATELIVAIDVATSNRANSHCCRSGIEPEGMHSKLTAMMVTCE